MPMPMKTLPLKTAGNRSTECADIAPLRKILPEGNGVLGRMSRECVV